MVTIYHNAKVYAEGPNGIFAECFAVNNGIFEFVGSIQEARTHYKDDPFVTYVDLNGNCVLPGFVEAHAHLIGKNIVGDDDIIFIPPDTLPTDLGKILKPYISGQDKGHTIKAMGINLSATDKWSALLLDDISPNNPIFVFSDDGHAMLMNTAAMKLAGIDKNTKDPGDSSYFVRDNNGVPTGLVIEIAALSMCREAITADSDPGIIKEKILKEIKKYSSLGYTMGFDAATIFGIESDTLRLLKELETEGNLNMELYLSFEYEQDDDYKENAESYMAAISSIRDSFDSKLIHPTAVKFILDGTIENKTACLFEAYADETGDKESAGLLIPSGEFCDVAYLAAKNGFSVHVHAIGDLAVRKALEGLILLKETEGTKTIAHNQLFDDTGLTLLKANPYIFYNTTPCWVEEDAYTLKALGPERYLKQFPTGSAANSGVRVTFGSDSLDEDKSLDPFWGIYYAMMRGKKETVLSVDIMGPESEGLSLIQAIDAYTINGAMQLKADDHAGSIKVGKRADFVILDTDIFTCDTQKIPDIKVVKTYFGGKPV